MGGARMVRLLHTGKWTSHPESRNKRQRKRDKKNKRDADNREKKTSRHVFLNTGPERAKNSLFGSGLAFFKFHNLA